VRRFDELLADKVSKTGLTLFEKAFRDDHYDKKSTVKLLDEVQARINKQAEGLRLLDRQRERDAKEMAAAVQRSTSEAISKHMEKYEHVRLAF
jgi:hypothetical protein